MDDEKYVNSLYWGRVFVKLRQKDEGRVQKLPFFA